MTGHQKRNTETLYLEAVSVQSDRWEVAARPWHTMHTLRCRCRDAESLSGKQYFTSQNRCASEESQDRTPNISSPVFPTSITSNFESHSLISLPDNGSQWFFLTTYSLTCWRKGQTLYCWKC